MLELIRRLFRRGAPPPEAGENPEESESAEAGESSEEIPEEIPKGSENASFVLRLLERHKLSEDSCQLLYVTTTASLEFERLEPFIRHAMLRKAGLIDKPLNGVKLADWKRCLALADEYKLEKIISRGSFTCKVDNLTGCRFAVEKALSDLDIPFSHVFGTNDKGKQNLAVWLIGVEPDCDLRNIIGYRISLLLKERDASGI